MSKCHIRSFSLRDYAVAYLGLSFSFVVQGYMGYALVLLGFYFAYLMFLVPS